MKSMNKILGMGLLFGSVTLAHAQVNKLPTEVAKWYEGGRIVEVAPGKGGQSRKLFVRLEGSGPVVTLIHGYPTSSYDWAGVASILSKSYTVLSYDLLSFGRSEKPRDHNYSTLEQADLLQGLWKKLGITQSVVVGHDIGAMVAEEVLARDSESSGAKMVHGLVIMNSSPYLESYQPLLINQMMATPVVGHLVGSLVSEKTVSESLTKLFSAQHPVDAQTLAAYWTLFSSDGGTTNLFGQVQWLPEKYKLNARWEKVLNNPGVPYRFVWGMNDPASGPAQAKTIQQRHPASRFAALPGIAHFPQIEVPAAVAEEINRLMAEVK